MGPFLTRICFLMVVAVGVLLGPTAGSADVTGPQADQRLPQSTAPSGEAIGSKQVPGQAEVAVLRAQLETSERYQDRLINTVYWALGTLCAVFLALIGFGWFANFRIYDRDRAALSKELREAVQAELLDIRRELGTELQQWENDAKESVEAATAKMHKNAQGELHSLQRQVQQLEMEIARLQAEVWSAKKLHGNAFSALIRAAEIGRRIDQDWQVNRSVDQIEKMILSMDGVFSSDLQKVSGFLNELGRSDSLEVQRLRDLLKTVKTL